MKLGWGCVPSVWEAAALEVRGDHQGLQGCPQSAAEVPGEGEMEFAEALPDRMGLTWSSCSHTRTGPFDGGASADLLARSWASQGRNSAFISGLEESEGELNLQTTDHFCSFSHVLIMPTFCF